MASATRLSASVSGSANGKYMRRGPGSCFSITIQRICSINTRHGSHGGANDACGRAEGLDFCDQPLPFNGAVIKLDKRQERVVNIVKGAHGFKNKSEAINHIIAEYEDNFLEPELKPEFIAKMQKLEKEPTISFSSMKEFEDYLRHAKN